METTERQTRLTNDALHANETLRPRSAKVRPRNTSVAYGRKQNEFRRWCDAKKYGDGHTATADKLLIFLTEVVLVKKKREQGDHVGVSTVKGYVAAIQDLHREQKSMGMNSHLAPRDARISQLLRTLSKEKNRKDRMECNDRGGIGTTTMSTTTQDGCNSLVDVSKMADYMMQLNSSRGVRDRCSLLLSTAMSLRGETIRAMALPDLFTLSLDEEGFLKQTVPALVAVVERRGQPNSFHEKVKESSAALRSKDVRSCGFGALALYMFQRFEINHEPFPDMSDAEAWYEIKVFKSGEDQRKAMSYATQYQAISAALKHLGFCSKSPTQIGRQTSMNILKQADATDIHLQRRWARSAGEVCYSSQLPRESMRVLAGFNAKQSNYYIERSMLEPPSELRTKIFANLEMALMEQMDPTTTEPPNMAAIGFLKLLNIMRSIIIQDAVFLMKMYPNHEVFQHEIFGSEAFVAFSERMLEFCGSSNSTTLDRQLQQCIPIIHEKLVDMAKRHEDAIVFMIQEMRKQRREMREQQRVQNVMAHALAKLTSTMSGPMEIRFGSGGGDSSIQAATCSSFPKAASSSSLTVSSLTEVSEQLSSNSVPQCKMSTEISTVSELFDEFTFGINGQSAIETVERMYGTKWRKQAAVSRFYQRRKQIIDGVRRHSEVNGCSLRESIQRADALIVKKSLHWLSQNMDCLFEVAS